MSEEAAWCAGFLDGEGSFVYHKPYIRKNRPGKTPARLTVSAQQKDRRNLDRLAKILGGNVYGPYENKSTIYCWTTTRHVEFEIIVSILWPYLGEAKKEQIERSRALYANTLS